MTNGSRMHAIFEQDRRLSRETLILDDKNLQISSFIGRFGGRHVLPLTALSPKVELKSRLFFSMLLAPLLIGTAMLVIAIELIGHNDDGLKFFGTFAAVGVIYCCWAFIVALRPIEVSRFRDIDGKIVVEIVMPEKRKIAYREFVDALVRNIKAAHGIDSRDG